MLASRRGSMLLSIGSSKFTVNLLDPIESNIEPRREASIAGNVVRSDEVRRQPQELWKWVVLAGLVLLLVEWFVYNRRVYV